MLLGDYLYAHGLVRVSDAGGVEAVAAMAELISRCASLRAAGEDGDGEAWVEAARSLGGEPAAEEIAALSGGTRHSPLGPADVESAATRGTISP